MKHRLFSISNLAREELRTWLQALTEGKSFVPPLATMRKEHRDRQDMERAEDLEERERYAIIEALNEMNSECFLNHTAMSWGEIRIQYTKYVR